MSKLGILLSALNSISIGAFYDPRAPQYPITELQPYRSGRTKTKQRMLAFIAEHPNCFERSLAIGHITASAWLVNRENTHALMMHHAKLGIWVQLGGHCDGNPNPLEVAIKEAQEESGICDIVALSPDIFDIDIHLIPANSKEQAHYHYDIRFLLQVQSNEPYIQNSESKELRWVSKNRAELPTDHRSITRMFDKWVGI
jgi:8-oxo-dGTP pyrophosphatase MutT (NUDIX family)